MLLCEFKENNVKQVLELGSVSENYYIKCIWTRDTPFLGRAYNFSLIFYIRIYTKCNKKKTLWPPKGTESARWIPRLLTNFKKKTRKKRLRIRLCRKLLKIYQTSDVYRKLIQAIKNWYIILNLCCLLKRQNARL